MNPRIALIAASLLTSAASACDLHSRAGPLDLSTATLSEVSEALNEGKVTSEKLVRAYLRRIEHCDRELHATIAINPAALAEARQLDAQRAAGGPRSHLHGVPLIIKDNIDVAGMVTTAGSLALAQNLRDADAPVVARLRAAGVIVLAKANLSEWANFRSRQSSSGWSAVGGLTRNPHDPSRSACGSSSGSAVAVVERFAAAAIGTETNGSIVCPASVNGIVGLKPTVGLIPAAGIVPISHTQDTAGPMTATVRDAALLMPVLTGNPELDASYRNAVLPVSLKGRRLGVARFIKGYSPGTEASFNAALEMLRLEGAVLVDIEQFDYGDLRDLTLPILLTEFKVGINAYLATTPPAVPNRNLEHLIAFNRAAPAELQWFGQDLFEQAQATAGLDDPVYLHNLARAHELSRGGLDKVLREHAVEALLAPTTGPAWSIDLINGDRSVGSASMLPAVAGYPHLTVPMSPVSGMPVGLSLFGAPGSEDRLISLGHAFQTTPGSDGRDVEMWRVNGDRK